MNVFVVVFCALAQPPAKSEKPVAPEGPPSFEIVTSDRSQFRVALLDSSLDLTSPYGKLTVPIKEIRKIEIGVRLTDEEQAKLTAGLAKLAGPDRKARVVGKEAVVALGSIAVPGLRRAKRGITDQEVIAMFNDLDAQLAPKDNRGEITDRDTIVTDGSTFTGRLTATELSVLTGPFGTQKLKVTDLVVAKSLATGSADDEGELIVLGPAGLQGLAGQVGKVFRVRVTGVIAGNLWGTGTYTLDSYLPMAAIHAGAIRQGETAVVKIRMVASPNQFAGTVQNNVQSMPYGQYPGGAFEVLGKAKDQGDGNPGGAGINGANLNRAVIIRGGAIMPKN